MEFDIKTIYVVNALVAFSAAGASFLTSRQYRGVPGLIGWGIGMILGGMGSLLLSQRIRDSSQELTFAAEVLVIAGFTAGWLGVRKFNGASPLGRRVARLLGLLLAIFATVWIVDVDLKARIAAASSIIGVLSLLCAYETYRAREYDRLLARTPTAVGFAILGSALLLQALILVSAEGGSTDFAASPATGLAQIGNSVGLVLLTIGLLTMTQERMHQRFSHLASTDDLTGLPNRRAFLERLMEMSRSAGCPGGSLLAMDIDHFAAINTRFGHAGGDKALRAFACYLNAHLRANDLVGRIGGEEFCVWIGETRPDEARVVAERLRLGIAALRVPMPRETSAIAVSIGVARFRCGDPDGSLRAADAALYRAKALGRNRVVVSDDVDDCVTLASPRGFAGHDMVEGL